jgi:hypothetical protein
MSDLESRQQGSDGEMTTQAFGIIKQRGGEADMTEQHPEEVPSDNRADLIDAALGAATLDQLLTAAVRVANEGGADRATLGHLVVAMQLNLAEQETPRAAA